MRSWPAASALAHGLSYAIAPSSGGTDATQLRSRRIGSSGISRAAEPRRHPVPPTPRLPRPAAVSTHNPSSSTATVCSQCAARAPSSVTTVHSSSSSRVKRRAPDEHRLDGHAQTGPDLGSTVARAVVEHVGRLVHRRADPVADVLLDDAVPGTGVQAGRLCLVDEVLDRLADDAEPVARGERRDPGPERSFAGRAASAWSCSSAPSSTTVTGRVTVPAVHDRAAVDTHDVARREDPRAGDAVHDLVVHRDAQVRRVPVVAQERGGRAMVARSRSPPARRGRRWSHPAQRARAPPAGPPRRRAPPDA